MSNGHGIAQGVAGEPIVRRYQESGDAVDTGRAKRDRKKLRKEKDKIVAAWFDAAVRADEDKADAIAGELGVDPGYLSQMRSGKVPIAGRHLLIFLHRRRRVL